MNKRKNNLEKIAYEALELFDKGTSVPDILALFPEYGNELKKLFEAASFLIERKDVIMPRRKLLVEIIDKMGGEKNVTKKYLVRNNYGGLEKGRTPQIINNSVKIYNSMTKWKLWAPVGLVVIAVLVVFGVSKFGYNIPQIGQNTGNVPSATTGVNVPAATGNIDDAVAALLQESATDQSVLDSAVADQASVTADSQEFSNFGDSINTNAI